MVHKGETIFWKFGQWSLEADDTEPAEFDAQVGQIVSQTTDDLAVWRGLAERCRIILFCGWFMKGWNEGIEISPQTLRLLAERGITLSIELYRGGNDDDDAEDWKNRD
jgi:hypothetical protein